MGYGLEGEQDRVVTGSGGNAHWWIRLTGFNGVFLRGCEIRPQLVLTWRQVIEDRITVGIARKWESDPVKHPHAHIRWKEAATGA
jgi:hypothetical protein